MSPPPLDVVEERRTNASLVSSSASLVNSSLTCAELKERNYMGLSDCSSVDSCSISGFSSENRCSLHLKATELRLGLPGSHSPERDEDHCVLESEKLDEKPFFPLLPPKDGILSSSHKIAASGNKRGFSDAMDRSSEVTNNVFTEGNWVYPADTSEPEAPRSVTLGKFSVNTVGTAILASRAPQNSGVKPVSMKEHSGTQLTMPKEIVPPEKLQEKAHGANEIGHNPLARANNNGNLPTAKAQVVGWPPIRSFRKNNTLASTSKNNDEVDGKPGPGPLFVKVSMDGAPYLRKVDLRTYSKYQELSSALEKMFSCFTIGQCGPHCAQEREPLNESKLRDLLHGSEYVLTYEDKDGDWMLVGDVPWEMFVDSCRRMRIMKSCDAIGLAPRAAEKCKSRA